ncbi:unnamed protein product, partial [marine sediment metagenome]
LVKLSLSGKERNSIKVAHTAPTTINHKAT